jgi:hypothetical protein
MVADENDIADILLGDEAVTLTIAPADGDPRGKSPRGRRGSGGGSGRRARVMSVGGDVAGGNGRDSRNIAAQQRELAKAIAQFLGALSLLAGLFLLGFDDADKIALTGEEARAMSKLPARLLRRSNLASRVAGVLPWGNDAVELAMAAAQYWFRIMPVIAARQAELAAQRPYTQQAQQQRNGVPIHVASIPTSPVQPGTQTGTGTGAQPGEWFPYGAGYSDPDATSARAYRDVAASVAALAQ